MRNHYGIFIRIRTIIIAAIALLAIAVGGAIWLTLTAKYVGSSYSHLTDPNWTNGISNFGDKKIMLFNNSGYTLRRQLQNSSVIKSGDNAVKIISVEIKGKWIHVTIDDAKKATIIADGVEIIAE